MKLLICGTRKAHSYRGLVYTKLSQIKSAINKTDDLEIIEGCCPDSADKWAEEWAIAREIKIYHYPSTSGNYLKRNIEMIEQADMVIAFWDDFSYGTAHTIAHAAKKGILINIVDISKRNEP